MMELTCAFTLALVSLVVATPHGYGVKGGAKAEASAVAGSLSGLPLSIPSGSGFSGSFSKSASSSFASSSASSSSSSFSYSGSGSSGVTGFGTKSDGDCSNGGCHKNVAGSQGISGIESNRFPVHSSANAAATAGAIALAGSPGSSKDNSLTCTSGECSNQSSENLNSGTNLSGGEKAGFSRSDSAANSGSDYVSNNKCASGKCGLAGHPTEFTAPEYEPTSQFGAPSINNGPTRNCASGKCGPVSQAGAPLTNYRPDTNCASGKCGSASPPGAPLTNYEPSYNCASGKCGSAYQSGLPSTIYGSSGDCTSGKCETGSQPGAPLINHEPNTNCASGKCGSTFPSDALSTQYGSDGKCAFGQCGPTSSSKAPSSGYGPSGATLPSTGLNNCQSGYCEPNTLTAPAIPNYEPNDIAVIISGTSTPKSTQDFKEKISNYDKTSTDCSFGNCGQTTSPNLKPSYPDKFSTTYENTNLPNQNQGSSNFGYNSAFGSGLASGYNKPASHLTTPKQTPSYTPGNTFDTGHIQATYTPSNGKTCTSGNCDYNSSKGPTSSEPEAKCTSSNCAPNTYNNDKPKIPGQSTTPEYQIPSGPHHGSPSCAFGNCATYPSAQPTIGFSSVSTGQYKPSYSHNQASQQTPLGSTGSVGFPSFPSTINTPLQSGHPSITDTSAGTNSQPGISPLVSISKPSTPDQKVPVYTGGFGGPAGILKPNEFSTASIGINKPNYPLGPSSHPVPTEGIGFPSHPSGFGTSPTPLENPSATIAGVPPYNTPTGSASTNCKTPNCGNFPSAGSAASAGATSQSIAPSAIGGSKPSSSDQKLPVYTGGFGGPAGVLKPNDFSISTQVPASQIYSKPTIPTGTYNPAACTTGNCGLQSPLPHVHDSSLNKGQASAIAAASANAEADAVAYTGGFGGPPGLLKPYDDGKLSSSDLIKHSPNSQFGLNHDVSSSGIHSSYGSDNNKYGAGSQAGLGGNAVAGAQASAAASSGSVSGILNGYGTHPGHYNDDHKGPGECGGDCGSNASGSYRGGSQFGHNGGLGLTKHGHHDGLGSNLARSESGATAKSLAGAVSGANAFGASGSFASSSATAHASAGAGTKGGYYGR